jgi:DNA primase
VPSATVSTPIDWSEIPDADPRDFTVRTVPPRFASLGDLHAKIDDQPFSLETLLEWADRDEKAGLADTEPPE